MWLALLAVTLWGVSCLLSSGITGACPSAQILHDFKTQSSCTASTLPQQGSKNMGSIPGAGEGKTLQSEP